MGKKNNTIISLLDALRHQTNDLLANQMLYNEIVDNNVDGLLVVDAEGFIRFANTRAARMFHCRKPRKLEGEVFGFKLVENEISEIEVATEDNKLVTVEIHSSRIEWNGQAAFLVALRSRSEHHNVRESLLKASESLRALINASPLAIAVIDLGGSVTLWNKAAEHIFGWSELDLRGHPFPQQTQRQASPLHDVIERVLYGESLSELEIAGPLGCDASDKVLHVWATPLRDSTGLPSGAMLMMADITERKRVRQQMEIALMNSEERFRLALNSSPITVSSQDVELRYTWVYKPLAGMREEEMLGRTDAELFLAEDAAELSRMKRAVLSEGGVKRGEARIQREERTYYYDISIEPIFDPNGATVGVACAAMDISALRYTEAHAAFIAHHDILTGLPNRVLFRDRLQQAFILAQREGIQRFAVLHFGLDRFKSINQSLGHTIGDQLLFEVSRRLVGAVFESDTVARVGGDEFLILAHNVRASQDAALVGKKVFDALACPFTLEGHEIFLTASIGIAVYPHDGPCADDMLRNADSAMYRAKEEGPGNYLFFSEEMNSSALEKLILENDLRRALENDEFLLHYQPQIDPESNAVIAVEALIRWAHPEKGLVPPALFIPAAESTGLIEPIGEWVLRAACRQHRAWTEAGLPPLRIAVNLSARQFLHGNTLVQKVSAAILESGMDPRYLELELTESMLMHNVEDTVQTLRELKQMGVHLSIDDFGTGYSSFSHLKRFPLDTLKIDRSFIGELGADADGPEITRAIIAMAHTLRLKVVAEGVETLAQLEFLRASRCDFIQGYYFSPPLPAEHCARLVANTLADPLEAHGQPGLALAALGRDVGGLRALGA